MYGRYPAGVPMRANGEEAPFLRVTGEGRVEAPPDAVEINLGFTTRAPRAAEAYQQTAAAMTKVVDALTQAGVPRQQLQSAQISLVPVYREEQLEGYQASADLRVTLTELERAGEIIDLAVAAGANTVRSIRFEVRNPGPYEDKAYAQAVEDGRRTAAVLARAMGARLGPIRRAEAEPAAGPVFAETRFAMAAAPPMPVLPGTEPIVRQVRLEFYMLQS